MRNRREREGGGGLGNVVAAVRRAENDNADYYIKVSQAGAR